MGGITGFMETLQALDPRIAPIVIRALQGVGCLELFEAPPQDCKHPDLLEVLEPWQPDHAWVTEAAAATAALSRSQRVAVTQCELEPGPDGYIAIDVRCEASQFEVRPGDLLVGGFALLRQGDELPQVLPRLYRLICVNGSVHLSHDGEAITADASTIGDAIDSALAVDIPRAAEQMQRASRMPAPDWREFLRQAAPEAPAEAIIAGREDDDDSLYGLVNAVTAHARRTTDFGERLHLESAAGRLLDFWHPTRRPGPARPGAAARKSTQFVTM